jgi:hypothetical protein
VLGKQANMPSLIRYLHRRFRWLNILPIALLLGLMAASASADTTAPKCLWMPPRRLPSASPPGTARIQYLQINGTQIMDDATAALIASSLGPDRTLHFQYEQDWPDDHVFPNGISMGQIHQWLSTMIDAWNQEPLMPLQLSLDRGNPGTGNLIRLDDDSSETSTNAGIGGYSWQSDGTTTTFSSRAVLNVGPGSLNTRELMEFIAKHELGHCLTLAHTCNRAASMGYQNGNPDYWARVGHFAMDDLLGLRAVWARSAPGYGALEGHLQYQDGSAVGGADIVAIDDQTGEVLASNVTDGQDSGRFRIELPAGRQVRLIAHPQHADAALFGEHFLPSELLTPGGFEPTEFKNSGQTAVFTVPDGTTQEIDPVMVDPPADTPLLNTDAPVVALLPGARAHLAMNFDGLGSDPVTVSPSLMGLSVANVTQTGGQVEFDVTAAQNSAGVSTIEVHDGSATNLQVGSVWVRPLTGLVLANGVEPKTLVRGATTEAVISVAGTDPVTGVKVISETGTDELAAELEGPETDGEVRVKVTVPTDAAVGPWDIQLMTGRGEMPQPPEPRPRLWVGTGRIRTDSALDLGDVPVGQPIPVSVRLTNRSSDPYTLSTYQWNVPQGGISIDGNLTVSPVAPGADGTLSLNVTPTQLGPTVVTFQWMEGGDLDAVTEVRFWAVPAPSGN